MAKKKAFVLRIDSDVFDQVEKWASEEFRSTNGHLEYIIHKALFEAKRLPNQQVEKQKKAD
jgi:hypothetical protein